MLNFTLPFFRLLAVGVLACSPMLVAESAEGHALPARSGAHASWLLGEVVPGRFLVVYRNATIPGDAEDDTARARGRLLHRHELFGIASVFAPDPDPAAALTRLAAQPNVEFVVRDRLVSADRLSVRSPLLLAPGPGRGPGSFNPPPPVRRLPIHTGPILVTLPDPPDLADHFYTDTPEGWAVREAGGYGHGVPGGPAHGPWDVTEGRGVRIAILDSGMDAHHPDLAPNLAFNLSEVDQTALPSPCDDGSAADQQGHGTWTASLAAAALGPGTGQVVGVAPQATLLNIKVLERLPDGDGSDPANQCPGGQASGLLSWVLQGIQDALAQHADIISMSLGTVIDLDTGDGAGLKATFDRVTHAATEQGAVLIAAAGNDGFDLSNPRYLELPAQSRDVLAIVASTNPGCAQDLTARATCSPGPPTLAYYSNFGAPLRALAAPGGSLPAGPDNGVSGWIRGACSSGLPWTSTGVPSTPGQSFGCFSLGHTPYVQAMGTSAAAPLAAGVAALLRAAHPTWDANRTLAALRSSATLSASLPVPAINAAAALALP